MSRVRSRGRVQGGRPVVTRWSRGGHVGQRDLLPRSYSTAHPRRSTRGSETYPIIGRDRTRERSRVRSRGRSPSGHAVVTRWSRGAKGPAAALVLDGTPQQEHPRVRDVLPHALVNLEEGMGSGFKSLGLGVGVSGSGFRVQSLGLKVRVVFFRMLLCHANPYVGAFQVRSWSH